MASQVPINDYYMSVTYCEEENFCRPWWYLGTEWVRSEYSFSQENLLSTSTASSTKVTLHTTPAGYSGAPTASLCTRIFYG